MSDLIDRQDAIDALRRVEALTRAFGYHNVIETIRELPSAQPEQRCGKWIKDCNVAFYWKCSECGSYLFFRKEDYLLRENDYPNYCPNCGADMREGKDGSLH